MLLDPESNEVQYFERWVGNPDRTPPFVLSQSCSTLLYLFCTFFRTKGADGSNMDGKRWPKKAWEFSGQTININRVPLPQAS